MRVLGRHARSALRLVRRCAPVLAIVVLALGLSLLDASRAYALKAIEVTPDQERIEITPLADLYEARGDSLQIETAPGVDGVTGRMSVSAATPGTNPNWIVFALSNKTERPIERWLSAERYSIIGSGIVWPDLDARRIEGVTPSIGFVPERIKSDRADVFRVTLEPGQTITYVTELASERFQRIYLWKPLDYELKSSDRQLFNGVMLGLTGLMAIFLTSIFAANHKVVFPASALVAWCTLGYLCVDFGFFHKLFNMKPEANAVYRAASESAVAASLVVFLHVFLRLALWHGLVRMLISVWLLAQFSLIAVAIIDPRLAATFARLSFAFIGVTGAGLTLYLAVRGQDRALSLIPTWILFLVWIFFGAVVLTGKLSGDIVVSGLVAGLVLLLMLIGFTVTQYAFRSAEPHYGGSAPSELQSRSVAVDAAGAAVWEWNARRDEIKVNPIVESWLGLLPGELSARTDEFIKHLHPWDRERFRLALFAVQERRDGRIACDFRIRQADNSYRWFEIEGAGIPGSDPRAFRCAGLVRDVTEVKRAHERLLHDAVHDSVTGLPNRELIVDRLGVAVARAEAEPQIRPTVITIDIDKFTDVNSSLGLVLGDSLLLTVARRLQRHLGPMDTLARLSGDRFAILILGAQPVAELAQHAERIRRSLRSPIKIAGQEMVLTGSLGIAMYEGDKVSGLDLLQRSEIAMYRAKRAGADRIEVYTPEMRGDIEERRAREDEVRRALDKNQLKLFYKPIIYLPTEELAGFEAVVRYEHPKLGLLDPCATMEFAEDSDLVVKVGAYALSRAARDVAGWQKDHPRPDEPLFVTVNVSCPRLFKPEAVQELRHILARNAIPKGALKLEVAEHIVLENPELAIEVIASLKGAGADIVIEGFATGYSSFAYLERLPFDGVKIDQAVVQAGSAVGTGDATLARSIVAVAREMGKEVIASGVAASGDASFLRAIGCEFAEGPHCGPMIAEADVQHVISVVRRDESKLKPRQMFKTKPQKRSAGGARRPEAADVDEAVAAKASQPSSTNGARSAAQAAAAGASRASNGAAQGQATAARAANGGAPDQSPPMPPRDQSRPAQAPPRPVPQPAPQPMAANGAAGAMPQTGMPAAAPMPPPMRPMPPVGSVTGGPPPVGQPMAAAAPPVPPQPGPPPSQPPQMAKPFVPPPVSRVGDILPEAGVPPAPPQPQVYPPQGAPLAPVAAVAPAGPPLGGGLGAKISALEQLAAQLEKAPLAQPPQPRGPSQPMGNGNGAPPPLPQSGPPPGASQSAPAQPQPQRSAPDFSGLPPQIAESLARLAGAVPPRKPASGE